MTEMLSDEAVDEALQTWRQGDCSVGDVDFVSIDTSGDIVQSPCRGYMLVSQTCDVVRSVATRPLLEVAALVEILEREWWLVLKGHILRYASVPALHNSRLAADLDRVMTVSKRYVATWPRTIGWETETAERFLRHSLMRKRGRPAFPDDVTALLDPLRRRWVSKHGKASPEGQALASMREIRLTASPSMDAAAVDFTLWLLWDNDSDFEQHRGLADNWASLVPSDPKYTFDVRPVLLRDLSAEAYVDSDPLDLDHLSLGTTT